MLKAMLIDDEEFNLKELQCQLKSLNNINIVGAFTNPLEGYQNIDVLAPNVVFLDIDMPEISGIYLAELIIAKQPEISVIFVTAHNQYAIDAFELNAVDYILKPFSLERIKKSIDRLNENKERPARNNIRLLSEQYKESIKKVFVYDNEDIVLLSFKELYYLEAVNKYVRIRTKEKFYNAYHSLNYYEKKLNNLNFFRAHRSYLVNLDKIIKISPKINYSFDIQFKDLSDLIPVSRSNVKLLKQLLEL